MVRLTRIYTRQGDGGETHLGDMSRTRKTSLRVAAFGDVDETNSTIGVARTLIVGAPTEPWLARIQNDLFDVGADLSVPEGAAHTPLRITPDQVGRLEVWCDQANDALAALTSFVLPGGTPAAAALHVSRAVCRRAERSVVALAEAETINGNVVAYLNRLSDLLFILARTANPGGDVLWVPGGPPEAA
jgi:cob(I)alamin adenosyltransferase